MVHPPEARARGRESEWHGEGEEVDPRHITEPATAVQKNKSLGLVKGHEEHLQRDQTELLSLRAVSWEAQRGWQRTREAAYLAIASHLLLFWPQPSFAQCFRVALPTPQAGAVGPVRGCGLCSCHGSSQHG